MERVPILRNPPLYKSSLEIHFITFIHLYTVIIRNIYMSNHFHTRLPVAISNPSRVNGPASLSLCSRISSPSWSWRASARICRCVSQVESQLATTQASLNIFDHVFLNVFCLFKSFLRFSCFFIFNFLIIQYIWQILAKSSVPKYPGKSDDKTQLENNASGIVPEWWFG